MFLFPGLQVPQVKFDSMDHAYRYTITTCLVLKKNDSIDTIMKKKQRKALQTKKKKPWFVVFKFCL